MLKIEFRARRKDNGVPFTYRFQGRSIWGGNGWELTECKEAVDNGQ